MAEQVRRWGLGALTVAGIICLVVAFSIASRASIGQWVLAAEWRGVLAPGLLASRWELLPAGRLMVPALGVDYVVVEGQHAAALAFGPGFRQLTTAPDTVLISGHRDTHFAFLEDLAPGAQVLWQRVPRGGVRRFRIARAFVLDSRIGVLPIIPEGSLVLITCYPFEAAVPGGPLRYLVLGVEEKQLPTKKLVL